jgi:hypothetical protein
VTLYDDSKPGAFSGRKTDDGTPAGSEHYNVTGWDANGVGIHTKTTMYKLLNPGQKTRFQRTKIDGLFGRFKATDAAKVLSVEIPSTANWTQAQPTIDECTRPEEFSEDSGNKSLNRWYSLCRFADAKTVDCRRRQIEDYFTGRVVPSTVKTPSANHASAIPRIVTYAFGSWLLLFKARCGRTQRPSAF